MFHWLMIHVKQTGALVGYARTSTIEQTAGLEFQIQELRSAGCDRIFHEHASAADKERPELQKALAWLRAGDVFVITRPDRLARSVRDLLTLVDEFRDRDVSLRILGMSLDTGNPTSMLTLSVLAAVAEWERSIMLERQRIGIASAKAAGKYRGRAPTARAKAGEVLRLNSEGRSAIQIADALQISRASVYRALKQAELIRG